MTRLRAFGWDVFAAVLLGAVRLVVAGLGVYDRIRRQR